MKHISILTLAASLLLATAAASGMNIASRTALGPPLICFPWEIGSAKSLPWSTAAEGMDVDPKYKSESLVTDTLTILDESKDPLVHAETLLRAAIYASRFDTDKKARGNSYMTAIALQVMDRGLRAACAGNSDPLRWLDVALVFGIDRNMSGSLQNLQPNATAGESYLNRAIDLSKDDGAMHLLAAAFWLDTPNPNASALIAKHYEMALARTQEKSPARTSVYAFRERFNFFFDDKKRGSKESKK